MLSCKKSGQTMETSFKLHGKEKALTCLVELKGQPSGKVFRQLQILKILTRLLHLQLKNECLHNVL